MNSTTTTMNSTTTTKTARWSAVPDEIKFAILKADTLSVHDVRAFSSVDTHSYHLCLPILFNTVKLPSREALDNFLDTVPSSYYPFIQELDICTKPQNGTVDRVGDHSDEITEKIGKILARTNRLTHLSLCIGGSLRNTIIPLFALLTRLHTFSLANWADEEVAPLSERLAMALSLSLPALRDLSLARVTRSALYAPELLGGTVPVVHNDADVSAADGLPELRLPSLLGLSRLRRLRIRETHLGDQLWGTVNAASDAPELEVLDLGASPYETPAFNDQCTQRILSRAPTRFLHTFSLSTGASPSPSSPASSLPCPPSPTVAAPSFGTQHAHMDTAPKVIDDAFPNLRTLHLTPLVPPPLLSSTLAQPALAQSPVHTLSCAFDPADAAEGCRAVEGFLWQRGMNPLPNAFPASTRAKRTRSGSLATIRTPTSSSSQPLKRRSTLSSSGSRAYPALQTLSISLSPPEPPATPATYSPKLAARLQARRAREAEERAQAARSLVKCCQTLGVHAEVAGIEIGDISEEDEMDIVVSDELPVAKPVTMLNGRSRSKTA